MQLFVGNLKPETVRADLERIFGSFGTVRSAKVVMDRSTGRSRGFGFVEMGTEAEGRAAATGLDGHEVEGLCLRVGEARPNEPNGGFRRL
jgi:cold-inducible RNA-binding protein